MQRLYLFAWTYTTMLSVSCLSTEMEINKKICKNRKAIHFLYHLCSTTHQHSLHWQLHCIPTSSSISSHSTAAPKHLQHPWANTHAFCQALPCLWHETVQRVYAWRSPVHTIMIIKSPFGSGRGDAPPQELSLRCRVTRCCIPERGFSFRRTEWVSRSVLPVSANPVM